MGIRSVADLQRAIEDGLQPKYVFFWGHTPKRGTSDEVGKWVFSQWYPASFDVDDDHYPTAEHFMMAEKARLFGDEETRQAILRSTHPGEAKTLGREVQGFDEATWIAHRFEIVVRGNLAKFSRSDPLSAAKTGEDDPLRDFLLETGERVLVEASPRDRVWGIGLAENDPAASYPSRWKGLNLLGFALMEVRERLRSD
jgi:ribA/ribD-fused uncharacterized protein